MDAEQMTAAMFSGHLGESFQVDCGPAERLEVELSEVTEGPERPGQETFSLLFRGPPGPLIAQRTYALRHERLGELSLFLVPVGPDKKGRQCYEAVFNRLRE